MLIDTATITTWIPQHDASSSVWSLDIGVVNAEFRLEECGNRQKITTDRETEARINSAVKTTNTRGSQRNQKLFWLDVLESIDRGRASMAVWIQISVAVQNASSSKVLPRTFRRT
mmetsp:Transcript_25304/g.53956  ORF Transcript_25304/g.53956 Transcript_25304/m.53956 type:complete len:115 (-) Transcript_25304:481-825(-)